MERINCVIFIITLLIILNFISCSQNELKLKFTLSVYEGKNCIYENNIPTKCSINGLPLHFQKTFIFSENDDICLTSQETRTSKQVWPYSAGLTEAANFLPTWSEKIRNFCDLNNNKLHFTLYKNPLCKPQNKIAEKELEINKINPNVKSPKGNNYTELVECSIYLASSKISLNLFLILAYIAILLY